MVVLGPEREIYVLDFGICLHAWVASNSISNPLIHMIIGNAKDAVVVKGLFVLEVRLNAEAHVVSRWTSDNAGPI